MQHILQSDWRDFIVSDTVDQCSEQYNFFTDNLDDHLGSWFHPFLHKIDLVLHSQLRQFFQLSLKRWVDFFLQFKDAALNILKVQKYELPDNLCTTCYFLLSERRGTRGPECTSRQVVGTNVNELEWEPSSRK